MSILTPEELIDDIETHGENLSDYDYNFVDSMSKWLGDGKTLTGPQEKTLRDIHERTVG